jgi:NAD(P)-dependent dehydrogenase (short-subunit alcohol dehydrogenase family)
MVGRLAGKAAVVTGAAARGHGDRPSCSRARAKVVLVNRSAERAEKLANQIRQAGGRRASVFVGDVAKAEVAEAMAEFAVRTEGRLEILHNNVGIGAPETVTPADWRKVLDANLTTTMLCTKYLHPQNEGRAAVVRSMSSIAGAVGPDGKPGRSRLSTAKAGAPRLHPPGRSGLAPQSIRANCIFVGSAHTPRRASGERTWCPYRPGSRAWDIAFWRGLSGARRVVLDHRRADADRRQG